MWASRSRSAIRSQLLGREQRYGPRRVHMRQAGSRIDQDRLGPACYRRVIIKGRRRRDIGMSGQPAVYLRHAVRPVRRNPIGMEAPSQFRRAIHPQDGFNIALPSSRHVEDNTEPQPGRHPAPTARRPAHQGRTGSRPCARSRRASAVSCREYAARSARHPNLGKVRLW